MKFSVIIPAYNAAMTIDRTVQSVLNQTHPAFEILALDDGGHDDTFARLQSYHPRVTSFRRPNGGLASARNFLCGKASGEFLAFLDSDDLWHPRYLELQAKLFARYPTAVASITRHSPFRGNEAVIWPDFPSDVTKHGKLLEPLDFLRLYNKMVLHYLPSFCCLPRRILEKTGKELFPSELRGAEDYFLFNTLPLHGPVICFQQPFGAYRLTPGSLSSNRVRIMEIMLQAERLLLERTELPRNPLLARNYHVASASLRRRYGKYLMGAGKTGEAREQIKTSMKIPAGGRSLAKSISLYLTTFVPRFLQPSWPATSRD